MSTNLNKSYLIHLQELGHSLSLSKRTIDGFDTWYSNILPTNKNANILDFGCGLGSFLLYLKYKGYKNIEGVDSNEILCLEAQKRTDCKVELIDDIYNYSLAKKGSFDFINMKDVLEHLNEEQAINTLSQLKSTLKSKGIIFISVPQICGFTSIFTLYNDYTHKKLFTERSLKQILRASGFENIKLVYPKTIFNLRLSSILLKFIQKIWFFFIKLIYFIERPGEDKPPYLGDRISVIAFNSSESNESTF
ncbi:MAG TPA: class I SAM-dependent methyltransferase [Victivallales bacterium]|nr:class I SAM-dependent methyltransferase [Victivallales bacterium]HRR05969.1 class I SAM-dependent methyltransferase [Victivallales bacterium]HRU00425.1 class I SAM-dependent methyltransferase [Victivallales bacterium]